MVKRLCAENPLSGCEGAEAELKELAAVNPYDRYEQPEYGRLQHWPNVSHVTL